MRGVVVLLFLVVWPSAALRRLPRPLRLGALQRILKPQTPDGLPVAAPESSARKKIAKAVGVGAAGVLSGAATVAAATLETGGRLVPWPERENRRPRSRMRAQLRRWGRPSSTGPLRASRATSCSSGGSAVRAGATGRARRLEQGQCRVGPEQDCGNGGRLHGRRTRQRCQRGVQGAPPFFFLHQVDGRHQRQPVEVRATGPESELSHLLRQALLKHKQDWVLGFAGKRRFIGATTEGGGEKAFDVRLSNE
eukprot:scaffold7572_cov248-Pinguiococcus_pyrenoidosus.AAC.1